jgi:hypothetical protein
VVFGSQSTDVSSGRLRDGALPWVTFPDPSPRQSNELALCGYRRFSALDDGLQPIDLAGLGTPGIGRTAVLGSRRGPPNGAQFLLLGFDVLELPLLISDSRFLLLPPLFLLDAQLAGADGSAAFLLPVPADPSLAGARAYLQVWAWSGTALSGSRGLELVFCQ